MSKTLIQVLMEHNGLGMSGNKRSVQAGVVFVNETQVQVLDFPVNIGDTVRIGKRDTFTVND